MSGGTPRRGRIFGSRRSAHRRCAGSMPPRPTVEDDLPRTCPSPRHRSSSMLRPGGVMGRSMRPVQMGVDKISRISRLVRRGLGLAKDKSGAARQSLRPNSKLSSLRHPTQVGIQCSERSCGAISRTYPRWMGTVSACGWPRAVGPGVRRDDGWWVGGNDQVGVMPRSGPPPMGSHGGAGMHSVTEGVAACAGSWGHPLRRLRRYLPTPAAQGRTQTAASCADSGFSAGTPRSARPWRDRRCRGRGVWSVRWDCHRQWGQRWPCRRSGRAWRHPPSSRATCAGH